MRFKRTVALTAILGLSLASVVATGAVGADPTDASVAFADDFDRADGAPGSSWTIGQGTWQVSGGQLVAPGSQTNPTENIAYVAAPALSEAFTVSADMELTQRWNGVATNISQNGHGYNAYVLRMTRGEAHTAAHWQLIALATGTSQPVTLLAGSSLNLQTGARLTLTISSDGSSGDLAVAIAHEGTTLTDVVVDTGSHPFLAGAAGIYSNAGYGIFDTFRVATVRSGPVQVVDDFQRTDGGPGGAWTTAQGQWAVSGGRLIAPGSQTSPTEHFAYLASPELGSEFTMSADMELTTRWNGIATNIAGNGDGSYDAYVLRMTRGATHVAAHWQVIFVDNSARTNPVTLVASGSVDAAAGETLGLSLATYDAVGRLIVHIVRGGEVLAQAVVRPTVPSPGLYGGHAGLYSSAGMGIFDNVELTTESFPAVAPSVPQPLTCEPMESDAYDLGVSELDVLDAVEVDSTWAGHRVGQTLLTDGNTQYVAYYNADRVMTVAQRQLGSDDFVYKHLDNVLGWDSHNYVTMALDSEGQLHVTGNMHGDPFIYYRTTVAGDITTLTRITTLYDSSLEQRVTYPAFLKSPDGDLILGFRDGQSGQGVNYYYVYDTDNDQWSMLLDTPFFDGEGTRNAYFSGPTRGPDGRYHVSWVWRDTGDAATNSRISYMSSSNLVDWESVDGQPLTLPVTYSEQSVIVDDVPIYQGALNGLHKVGFDAEGNPTIAYHKYDGSGNSQLYVARAENGAWRTQQLTQWEGRWDFSGMGSIVFEVDVQQTSPLPDGNMRLDYACHGQQRTLVIDGDSLLPIAEVVDPPTLIPADLKQPTDPYPGLIVYWANDPDSAGETVNVLRWEALPTNRDQPRPEWPDPMPLMVYELGEQAQPAVGVDLRVSARSQCWGDEAVVAVHTVNLTDQPADIRFVTDLGEQKLTGVLPDAAAYHGFQSGDGSLPAGTAVAAGYSWYDGKGHYERYSVPYEAVACG